MMFSSPLFEMPAFVGVDRSVLKARGVRAIIGGTAIS